MGDKIVYIFLDIDGVLNKKADWKNKFTFNYACLNNFDKLINWLYNRKKYDCKIILTSTWRIGFKENNITIFSPLIRLLEKYSLQINGITPITADKSRQQEISYYIRRNNVLNYIILDDDKSLFDEFSDKRLYFTNCNIGFTEKDVKAIQRIIR